MKHGLWSIVHAVIPANREMQDESEGVSSGSELLHAHEEYLWEDPPIYISASPIND